MTFKEYALPTTLEEAWQLNQKQSNRVLGGTLWMRMSARAFHTAIDLSRLDLNRIEDMGNTLRIGAMVSLHELETCPALQALSGGAIGEALKGIVGVQFRNGATLGGSLFARFGFSDVLTVFMALDAQVELYKAGRMRLTEFAAQQPDNDILTHVLLKKQPMRVAYLSQRPTATDFPVLTAAVSQIDGQVFACVGARPMRSVRVDCPEGMDAEAFAQLVQESCVFGNNLRASAAYRRHLAGVLVRRGLQQIERWDA